MSTNKVNIDSFTKEDASKWIGELGIDVSWKREDLIQRMKKYLRHPKLVDKLRKKNPHSIMHSCAVLIPRAVNSEGRLILLDLFPNYFIQCEL